MKKYYLFAALATAGLFAGCSADDTLALDNGGAPQVINDNEKAPIQLFIGGAAGTTRGTGTVGSTEGDANNKWGGQKFKLMMLEKGKLSYALDEETGEAIYKSAVFTTPNQLAGAEGDDSFTAVEVTGTTDDGGITTAVKYFPQDGSFDFWAYRLDGAEGENEPAEDGDKLTVDFTIDGSQDIMVSKATPNAVQNADGTWGSKNVSDERVFSAYSVRREVTPKLSFNHLLTRLVFKVKASGQLSGTEGKENPDAIKVTAIKVKSLATGKLAVAWTPDAGVENAIEWTPESEAELELQQRAYKYQNAEVEFVALDGSNSGYYKYIKSTSNPECETYFDGDTEIYTTTTPSYSKGYPTGGTKADDVLEEKGNFNGYYVAVILKDRVKTETADVSENLEPLDPVIPMLEDNTEEIGGTQVGEALLVAPQETYQMVIELSQRVPTEQAIYDYTYEGKNDANVGNEILYFMSQEDANAYEAAEGEQEIAAAADKGNPKKERKTVTTKAETKTFTKPLTLTLGSSEIGNTATPIPFEANKSYTIKVTLAGQESGGIGGDVEIGPGYGDGKDIDVDMDE